MTKDMMQAVLIGYDARLANGFPDVEVKEFTQEQYDNKHLLPWEMVSHLRWMCQKCVSDLLPSFETDRDTPRRVATWLGFVQGQLLDLGIYSISEMRTHNRTGTVPMGGQGT